ncbi:hypothetical protein EYC59_00205 [Candidatus Saccharibacteria bacterium]|nr:MAG: hypothetical protein EYC59_00205 [Candidatus Saccharibacteria bacterium]
MSLPERIPNDSLLSADEVFIALAGAVELRLDNAVRMQQENPSFEFISLDVDVEPPFTPIAVISLAETTEQFRHQRGEVIELGVPVASPDRRRPVSTIKAHQFFTYASTKEREPRRPEPIVRRLNLGDLRIAQQEGAEDIYFPSDALIKILQYKLVQHRSQGLTA